jgi:hypothetical protein
MIRADSNKMEIKGTIQTISEAKSWCVEKIRLINLS